MMQPEQTPIERIGASLGEVKALLACNEPRHTDKTRRVYGDADCAVREVFGGESEEQAQFKALVEEQDLPKCEADQYPHHAFVRGTKRVAQLLGHFLKKLDPQTYAAYQAFGRVDLHPAIAKAAVAHFENGQYRSAVSDAYLALEALVQERSGRMDLDGKTLMEHVFSSKTPVLAFNELRSESEKAEQQGMMFLFSGAPLALRNPRAHGLEPDTAKDALEYITLLDLLAKWAMKAKRIA